MPRLTYCPSASSRATRAASCCRVSAISAPHRAPLDPLAVLADRADPPLQEDARRVHPLGRDLTRLDQPLHLGDGDPAGGRAERVEVAGAGVVDQVAVPVADRGPDQREVADDALLEHVLEVAEAAGLLGRAGQRDAAL